MPCMRLAAARLGPTGHLPAASHGDRRPGGHPVSGTEAGTRRSGCCEEQGAFDELLLSGEHCSESFAELEAPFGQVTPLCPRDGG